MFDLSKTINQWILLLFLAFLWGSSFILMKKALISYDFEQVASLRIFISFLFLLPIIIKNFKKIKKNQWINIFIAGLLGSGVPAYLFPLAQTTISSSMAGMLNSTVPLFTVIVGILFFGVSFRKLKFLGVLVGLGGALGLIFYSGSINYQADHIPYALIVVGASFCYATNVNFIKTKLKVVSSLNITSFGFLFIGPIAFVHLLSNNTFSQITSTNESLLHLFYISILAILGTSIAIILFNMLIKRVSAVFATTVTYIIPIFAMLWGVADGESISLNQIIFILIILTGVYIINKDNKLEQKTEQ